MLRSGTCRRTHWIIKCSRRQHASTTNQERIMLLLLFVRFPPRATNTRECIMILDIIIACLFDVVIDILRLLSVRQREDGWMFDLTPQNVVMICAEEKKYGIEKMTRININIRVCAKFWYLFRFQIILPGVPRNAIYIPSPCGEQHTSISIHTHKKPCFCFLFNFVWNVQLVEKVFITAFNQ